MRGCAVADEDLGGFLVPICIRWVGTWKARLTCHLLTDSHFEIIIVDGGR